MKYLVKGDKVFGSEITEVIRALELCLRWRALSGFPPASKGAIRANFFDRHNETVRFPCFDGQRFLAQPSDQ
jgi:hypothetical protein